MLLATLEDKASLLKMIRATPLSVHQVNELEKWASSIARDNVRRAFAAIKERPELLEDAPARGAKAVEPSWETVHSDLCDVLIEMDIDLENYTKAEIEPVAAAIGVSTTTVRNWIEGKTSPSEANFDKIVQYLHEESEEEAEAEEEAEKK